MNSNWSYSPETLNLGQNWWLSHVTTKFDGRSWKTIRHIFSATSSFVHNFIAIYQLKMELQSRNAKFGSNRQFFVPCHLEIWRMTLKNNRTSLLSYFKLCAFHSHLWIQNGVTVWKLSIWVKIGDFLSCVTSWKTIGHLFYAISSFVHHFIAICEFKIELQSRNAKFESKSVVFCPCDLEIWWMTLKNNRASLLCYFKLCASFHSHLRIQTRVTVRKQLS